MSLAHVRLAPCKLRHNLKDQDSNLFAKRVLLAVTKVTDPTQINLCFAHKSTRSNRDYTIDGLLAKQETQNGKPFNTCLTVIRNIYGLKKSLQSYVQH